MKQNEVSTLETVNFRRDIDGRGFLALMTRNYAHTKK